ncbi:MAG: hypothetical protein JWN72_1100 [Thermoleophilia bacterium]|nr:hypothetical protein [Thermoleophilia bacterium]
MPEALEGPELPGSLVAYDLLVRDADAEQWLELRARYDREDNSPRTVDELRANIRRQGNPPRAVGSADRTLVAFVATEFGTTGDGATYVNAYCDGDPGEPVLGDLVAYATALAASAGAGRVEFIAHADNRLADPLAARHGFQVAEHWRHFELAIRGDEVGAALSEGLEIVTLGARPDLAEEAFRVYGDSLDDVLGDFPRGARDIASWLERLDASHSRGRDHVALLVHGDEVRAMLRLLRRRPESDRADVAMLGVDRAHRGRGYARVTRAHSGALAASLGLTKLESCTRSDNLGIIRLCETQGWSEVDPHFMVRRELPTHAGTTTSPRLRHDVDLQHD